jgi:alkanesulfonate monooxygenase SsuD/methylene tetrahydromethanopterin reductase-like flavin-dependent oxidoreductase (luciferase family)
VLLRLVAKYADRWNYSIPESGLVDHKLKVLKEHCAAVGRDFNTLQTSEQVMVCLGRNKADADKMWDSPGHPMIEGMKPTAIKGDPDSVTEQLLDRAKRGVNMVMLCFGDLDRPETIELFGREVMPRLQ